MNYAPLLIALVFAPLSARGGEVSPATAPSPLLDPTRPYRTDAANDHLPWYQLKPGEFPPRGAEHRLSGELVEVDFVARTGQFRADVTGRLVDFALLPCAAVRYLDAEADLRDLPLGTRFSFGLFRDADGGFTQVASVDDDFSRLARGGVAYRVVDVGADAARVAIVPGDPPRPQEATEPDALTIRGGARLWKGAGAIALADLRPGDPLTWNLTGCYPSSHGRRFADAWVGPEARAAATAGQFKRHVEFVKARGLAGRIDKVEGKQMTVTFFGDSDGLAALLKAEQVDPAKWVAEGRSVDVVVADEALRTYNPPVDRQRSKVLASTAVPTDRFGVGGLQWVLEPRLLLEGFRAGRVVRVFAHPSWKVDDMPYGESLYTERPGGGIPTVRRAAVSPNQFPYRTDVGNARLPWYQLKPGTFPPADSHHFETGELLAADPAARTGRFRRDGDGAVVAFTMPACGLVRYLDADADLEDLPLGTRCAFYLYQDEQGAFTRAAVVTDDFTRSADATFTYRVESFDQVTGRLVVTTQLGRVKNDKDELYRPPDVGRGEFAVDADARVWDGDRRVTSADLKPGDEILFNVSGRTATSRGRCTEMWISAAAQQRATDAQRAKQSARLRATGVPGWVESVDGDAITVGFFAGNRKDFAAVIGDDPRGKPVHVRPADDALRPAAGPADQAGFKDRLPEGATAGTYGSSGVRWVLTLPGRSDRYPKGQVVRVFKEGWQASDLPRPR